jgi:hypothetical protein
MCWKNGTCDGHRSLGDVGHGGDGAGREAEPQQDLSQGAMDMAICVGKTVGTIQGENRQILGKSWDNYHWIMSTPDFHKPWFIN